MDILAGVGAAVDTLPIPLVAGRRRGGEMLRRCCNLDCNKMFKPIKISDADSFPGCDRSLAQNLAIRSI